MNIFVGNVDLTAGAGEARRLFKRHGDAGPANPMGKGEAL